MRAMRILPGDEPSLIQGFLAAYNQRKVYRLLEGLDYRERARVNWEHMFALSWLRAAIAETELASTIYPTEEELVRRLGEDKMAYTARILELNTGGVWEGLRTIYAQGYGLELPQDPTWIENPNPSSPHTEIGVKKHSIEGHIKRLVSAQLPYLSTPPEGTKRGVEAQRYLEERAITGILVDMSKRRSPSEILHRYQGRTLAGNLERRTRVELPGKPKEYARL